MSRADSLIRTAVQKEPDNHSFLDSLGWVLYKRGRFEQARDALQEAIDAASFPDPVVLDSYVLVDLTAGLRITDRLSLRARVENLLEEDYELADGFNTPERGVYVALRYGQSR